MFTQATRQHPRPTLEEERKSVRMSSKFEKSTRSNFHSLSPSTGDSAESASSSSLSNADSDSLHSLAGRHQLARQAPLVVESPGASSKSPVLIKYNYYDYNGARQEQTNHDMNFNLQHPNNIGNNREAFQRQLSPTFKQNLDQIMSQQLQHQRAASSPTPSPSPEGQLVALQLARRYKLSSYEQRCLRCNKTVYQMDKVGPLKDFTFYHQNCFKCRVCGTKLTLKTYFNNQQSSGDQEVYCHRHCPKTGPGKLDNQSVGIRAALNAPKVFEQGQQHLAGAGGLNGSEYLELRNSPLSPRVAGSQQQQQQQQNVRQVPINVDASALYIQHAVRQTRLQNIYRQSQVDSKISQFINRRLEFLEPKQKMLEMRHREEEDALFKAFELKWRQEEKSISEQIRDEWQLELEKLLDRYKRQLNNIASQQHKQLPPAAQEPKLIKSLLLKQLQVANDQQQQQQQQQQQPPIENSELSKQQMIEFERMNLEKTMTIKLDRKKETLKRKLKEFERQATAELVEKQSREMLALISIKLDEFKEEQKRKIGSDMEQFEAMESLANQLDSSLQLAKQPTSAGRGSLSSKNPEGGRQHSQPFKQRGPAGGRGEPAPLEVPAPSPPEISKMELYNNEEPDEVFKEIDQLAINVAREDQRTFTDLVHHLTRKCLSDVEKVRAIFRWITVKNLNTMQFDSSVKPDTPLGLLRGIKNGSESYHVLFKRLCSYAGLHCVVIKGYSKSAGYQPGIKFEGNRFRNSWNAVFVAGAWRFVQCNWGARHLVSVAVMQDKSNKQQRVPGQHHAAPLPLAQLNPNNSESQAQPAANLGRRGLKVAAAAATVVPTGDNRDHSPGSPAGSGGVASAGKQQNDSLRYEYDDHYFLTDPDEFIYEFFPLAPEWQLIKSSRAISLTDFEQLPFVRSLFFKYGLYFPQAHIRSVLHADSSGATTIKIGMPTHMIPSLIFHYNLKFYDNDTEHYEGVSLKRFVMQSVESGTNEQHSPASHNNNNNNNNGQVLLSNIVSFRVHLPANGSYILDIFANSTTPTQYITGEPMKFKSVCKFKIIAKNLQTVMIPLPDCASGEYGPLKATRLFGIIPITHENGLISVTNEKRFLEIQFRMTRPLLDFMASLHKNGFDERQLSKSIKIFIDGDIVIITIKFFEDGQYGLDVYTRDQTVSSSPTTSHATDREPANEVNRKSSTGEQPAAPKKQLLTHCCKYLINVKSLPPPNGQRLVSDR